MTSRFVLSRPLCTMLLVLLGACAAPPSPLSGQDGSMLMQLQLQSVANVNGAWFVYGRLTLAGLETDVVDLSRAQLRLDQQLSNSIVCDSPASVLLDRIRLQGGRATVPVYWVFRQKPCLSCAAALEFDARHIALRATPSGTALRAQ